MIQGIIICLVGLAITELVYFQIMLRYNLLDLPSEDVKINGKIKKAYRFWEAFWYKIFSLIIGVGFSAGVLEIIREFDFEGLITLVIVLLLISVVISLICLFFWVNWIFTKRRQGNQIPARGIPQF